MTLFRAALVAVMIVALAVSPYLVPNNGWSSGGASVYAATASAPVAQDNDDEDDDDDDDDEDDDGLSNDDDDDDGFDDDDNNGRNDNADDDDDDDGNNDNDADDDDGNDNDDGDPGFVNAPVVQAAPQPAACSTPGQETTFTSADGRIAVRVFSTMPQSVKFSVWIPIDPAAVPPAPGPVVDGLRFQLVAETCDGTPIASLPAEVNLGVHYSDADAAGLNEQAFTLAWLDTSANQWRTVEKQAADPPANYTSATIRDLGYYVLYQRS